MKREIREAIFGVTLVLLATGCRTMVTDQSPVELQEAEKSVKAARAADVEDYMPSAMEAANRRLERANAILRGAKADPNNDMHAQGIRSANEAKVIADGGIKLVDAMRAYDRNSQSYLMDTEKAARATELESELAALQQRYAVLEQERAAAESAEDTIPGDFQIGKPVAYFSTGSSNLAAKYRAEIDELANLLKKNNELQVKLEGFADPRGSAERNRILAERRLEAVAKQLRDLGVSDTRIQTVTVGETTDGTAATPGAQGGELQLERKVTATIMSSSIVR